MIKKNDIEILPKGLRLLLCLEKSSKTCNRLSSSTLRSANLMMLSLNSNFSCVRDLIEFNSEFTCFNSEATEPVSILANRSSNVSRRSTSLSMATTKSNSVSSDCWTGDLAIWSAETAEAAASLFQ